MPSYNWSICKILTLSRFPLCPVLILRIVYLLDGGTIEDKHHCDIIAKVQIHDLNNPTSKENLRMYVAETIVRKGSMTK